MLILLGWQINISNSSFLSSSVARATSGAVVAAETCKCGGHDELCLTSCEDTGALWSL